MLVLKQRKKTPTQKEKAMTGIRTRIDVPHRGFTMSLRHKIEILSGEAVTKQEKNNWIEVEENESGVFTVVNDNMAVKKVGGDDWYNTILGFSQWDDEVKDLDAGNSDESQSLGMSNHLSWEDVDLTPQRFRAPSIERLKEALNHIAICEWSFGDT